MSDPSITISLTTVGWMPRRIQQEIKQCSSGIDKEILPRLAENFHAQIRRMIEQPG